MTGEQKILIDVEIAELTELDLLRKIYKAIFHLQIHITMTLEELKVKVDNEATVEQSAITLIQGISQKLKDALGDPAQIQAIADELDANAATLSAAVSANTTA